MKLDRIKKIFRSFFNEKIDAIGLAIFRLFYSIILFFEVKQLYTFRHIIYDKVPFKEIGEIDVSYLFGFWFIAILFLFLGIFTRYITIINYLFSVIIFSSAHNFEYHVFYAYVGINFLLLFMPISRVLSLDSLWQKLKYTSVGKIYKIDRKVLKINYLILPFTAIGLVYFDSVFHKLSSTMWLNGLGVWLPSSLPMITWNDTSFLLNQKWLILFLGYLVLIFETIFIFLFWFKQFRIPFVILGMLFHIGILIAYPIPWFALTVIAVYLLMIPVSFWKKIASLIKANKPIYKFYYDAECPLCNKTVVLINHFDIFGLINCITVQGNYKKEESIKNYDESSLLITIHGVTLKGEVKKGYWAYIQLLKSMFYTYPLGILLSLPLLSSIGKKIYKFIAGNRLTERCTVENCAIPVFNKPITETEDLLIKGINKIKITQLFWKIIIAILIFGQGLMILQSPSIKNTFIATNSVTKNITKYPMKFLNQPYLKFLGVTAHPVFMYKNHFINYNKIFKVVTIDKNGKEIILPFLNNDGKVVKSYFNGALWVNATFRVNSPEFNLKKFEKGITLYMLHYIFKENKKAKNFKFYAKEITTSQLNWEKDFLKKQIKNKWYIVGEATYKDEIIFTWNNKMLEIEKKEQKR